MLLEATILLSISERNLFFEIFGLKQDFKMIYFFLIYVISQIYEYQLINGKSRKNRNITFKFIIRRVIRSKYCKKSHKFDLSM